MITGEIIGVFDSIVDKNVFTGRFTVDGVFDVDLGPLEPLVSIDHPPNNHREHWTAVDKAGPVHERGSQVTPSRARQAEDG